MASLDVICAGYLCKEGGAGHTFKNQKSRWFILKDLYLYYYVEKPADGKNTEKLKGIIFLPKCEIKDNPNKRNSFLLVSKEKEYIMSVPDAQQDKDNYLLSWRNSLEYVIERAQKFADSEPYEGWLQKRGGKGHGYQNWKKRHFVLKGNLLSYYGAIRKKEDDISQLKGFIEVSQIIELDSEGENYGGGPEFANNWKVTLDNGKEYIMAAPDEASKKEWIKKIKRRVKEMAKLQLPVGLNYKETISKSGNLTRSIPGKPAVTAYYLLTNLNLRSYRTQVDNTAAEADFGQKGYLGKIPLIGISILPDKDHLQLRIIDITGNKYVLGCENEEQFGEWIDALGECTKELVKTVIKKGESIRLNCLARNDAQNNGYTALTISKEGIQLNFFMLKRKVEVTFAMLRRVYMTEDHIFCLRYETKEDIRVLNIICSNAKGVHDAISAAFEVVTGKKKDTGDSATKSNSSGSVSSGKKSKKTDDAEEKGGSGGAKKSKSKKGGDDADAESAASTDSPRSKTKKGASEATEDGDDKAKKSKSKKDVSGGGNDSPRTKEKGGNDSPRTKDKGGDANDEKPAKSKKSSKATEEDAGGDDEKDAPKKKKKSEAATTEAPADDEKAAPKKKKSTKKNKRRRR